MILGDGDRRVSPCVQPETTADVIQVSRRADVPLVASLWGLSLEEGLNLNAMEDTGYECQFLLTGHCIPHGTLVGNPYV